MATFGEYRVYDLWRFRIKCDGLWWYFQLGDRGTPRTYRTLLILEMRGFSDWKS